MSDEIFVRNSEDIPPTPMNDAQTITDDDITNRNAGLIRDTDTLEETGDGSTSSTRSADDNSQLSHTPLLHPAGVDQCRKYDDRRSMLIIMHHRNTNILKRGLDRKTSGC